MKLRAPSCTLLLALLALGTPAWAAKAKVLICHIPPGNPDNFHTIKVSESAVQAHLNHGDYLGACQNTVTCPCNDIPGRFQDVVAGQYPIDHCFADSAGGIGVELVGSPYSLGSFLFEGQWSCRDLQFGGLTLDISPEQGLFCADLLEQAAANQAVPCL